uniref:PPPDE domain-containing protein n=1 Tax=Triticum urartu TaxID=4572 RepID=A0A8R7UEA7_TRIUA
MSRAEVHTTFLEDLAEDYHRNTHHLIARNCNHFTTDVYNHFTGKPTPRWVNRLARLG